MARDDQHLTSPEPIDRLLRIAYEEELAGNRSDRTPVRFIWVAGGEEQKYLRLERIGVLRFINEEMTKALLQLPANGGIVADEIARFDEKVEEIEPSSLGLQGLVCPDRSPQRVVQKAITGTNWNGHRFFGLKAVRDRASDTKSSATPKPNSLLDIGMSTTHAAFAPATPDRSTHLAT